MDSKIDFQNWNFELFVQFNFHPWQYNLWGGFIEESYLYTYISSVGGTPRQSKRYYKYHHNACEAFNELKVKMCKSPNNFVRYVGVENSKNLKLAHDVICYLLESDEPKYQINCLSIYLRLRLQQPPLKVRALNQEVLKQWAFQEKRYLEREYGHLLWPHQRGLHMRLKDLE